MSKRTSGTAAGIGRWLANTWNGVRVTFITLEDETGNVILVVCSATSRPQQQAYLVSKIMKISGILERKAGVTHVVAGKLYDMSDESNELVERSRYFHNVDYSFDNRAY